MSVRAVVEATLEQSNPILNISVFLVFVAVTLSIVIRASRNNRTAADYYAAGRSFSGPQNGFAIAGDYLSAATFLGLCGAIAVNGYDGFLYSLFWKRFTTRGAVWSMYGGLAAAVILIVLSPVFSGKPTSFVPGVDFAIWPLENPGILSMPLGFFLCWLGSVLDRGTEDRRLAAEMEVRSLTGYGVEKAVEH